MEDDRTKEGKIPEPGKRWTIFTRLRRESRKMRLFGSPFKWKRSNLALSFMDNLIFKILSALEAIVLGATLCFFFLCCGCHF